VAFSSQATGREGSRPCFEAAPTRRGGGQPLMPFNSGHARGLSTYLPRRPHSFMRAFAYAFGKSSLERQADPHGIDYVGSDGLPNISPSPVS
jgi:hypothetical protein